MADETCQWCGLAHGKLCPSVKAMDFDMAGNVTRVEFMTPMDLRPEHPPAPPPEPEQAPPAYPKLGDRSAKE